MQIHLDNIQVGTVSDVRQLKCPQVIATTNSSTVSITLGGSKIVTPSFTELQNYFVVATFNSQTHAFLESKQFTNDIQFSEYIRSINVNVLAAVVTKGANLTCSQYCQESFVLLGGSVPIVNSNLKLIHHIAMIGMKGGR